MLEGDPENWVAVARAISDCARELGWRHRELAARSHAPVTIAGTAFLSRFVASWTSDRADVLRMRSAVTVAAPWTW